MQLIQAKNHPVQHTASNMPLELAIARVMPRPAIDIDDCWYPWATDFALLSGAYLTRIAPGAPTGHWQQTYPHAPKSGGGGDRHHLKIGDTQLNVDYLQPAGWTIDLIHGLWEDPDSRIVTVARGDMPVLCPTLSAAMVLAEASFPNAHYHLYWRSIWSADDENYRRPMTAWWWHANDTDAQPSAVH
jgi:hypothetical protein